MQEISWGPIHYLIHRYQHLDVIFPCDYVDSWGNLENMNQYENEAFHNRLTKCDTSHEDNAHARMYGGNLDVAHRENIPTSI
ncbi:hypothetical protein PR048_018720 [Dryococelus australis]|uniref:Uncharacterized protein n=1 Tax=Dryococelus australis TaxID=614101 RepID=A0ABQ9HDB1_9NEOP|nr:hypothetical protein PR048_018720 [Dryococelus australis]